MQRTLRVNSVLPPKKNFEKYGKQSIVGKRFGRLLVLEKHPTTFTRGGNPKARWLCVCLCGKKKVVSSGELRPGKTKSCGCWLIESATLKGFENKTHGGYSGSASWDFRVKTDALANIVERARQRGYESDLEISDLPFLGVFCPVFGTAFKRGTTQNKDSAPSIDRIDFYLPYLKIHRSNLVFISHRANRIKSDATTDELRKILGYIETRNRSNEGVEIPEASKLKIRTLSSIRNRVRRRGYETDLEISDLPLLGKTCPILGIEYTFKGKKWTGSSPSIDRLNPNLPYLKKYKDNLFYISYRANALKSNATAEEMSKIVSYVTQSLFEKTFSNGLEPCDGNKGQEIRNVFQPERLNERAPRGEATV